MTDEVNKKKVFISYASQDEQLAKCIEYFLKESPLGLDVFIDVNIETGEDWDKKIKKELNNSGIFILW